VLLGLAVLALGQASAPADTFLHDFALSTTIEGPVEWARAELVITARGPELAKAAFVTRRKAREVTGHYALTHLDQLLATDAPQPRHSKPSWVIDFDQRAFGPALEAARAAVGEQPTPEALARFVAGFVTRKSYDHGFDLASQVAVRRGGDCTEHAVFLAALLRQAGIPARAMVGLVLIAGAGAKPQAFGHMWTEAWFEGAWRVADAALPPELRPAYLPVGELVDEGPGYALSLAKLLSALRFERLELRAGT
jgi:transglutaminase-like putative cysteine protease